MLHLQDIALHFGDRPLFDQVSTIINPGECIGLVGPNGAGKSTLLKIVAGEQQADSGNIKMSNEATVGYLPQDGVDPDPNLTVLGEVEHAFDEIMDLREELKALQKKLESVESGTEHHKKIIERFGNAQYQLENSGSYTLQADIEKVLMGLGFSESDFSRSTTEFSGGWLMRIALAKLLLKKPTYLLLDEPTNHLDIESLQWIESFLKNYEGAVVIVSHDRAFLDSITNRTLALKNGKLKDYAGNYSFYEKKAAEEQELLEKRYANQQKELKQTQEFIDRFRYKASKAKQVQSRIRQLEKMDLIDEPDDSQADISFRFPPPERSGQIVLSLKNVVKKYGDNTVFDGIDYEVERGDKIAVVGPNGAGKSTMIRILAGKEPITSGKREVGYNVTPGYFAQHQAEELNPNNTALEEMRLAGSGESETRLRTILGCFLFIGDDVFKKVQVLSGGEKSRLALAKMLLNPGNFLIFDEPTNHLDMQSKNILQQAFNQFEGTLMIVSHDRDFLDSIVNKTLEIQPGKIKTWLGNVSYYLDMRAKREAEQNQKEEQDQNNRSDNGLSRKEQRRIEAEKRNKLSAKVKPLKKRLENIEQKIEVDEARKAEIEKVMADPDFYDDSENVKDISLEYEELKSNLAANLEKWEEIAGRIEFIEEEFDAA